jgi:hypothetical protein
VADDVAVPLARVGPVLVALVLQRHAQFPVDQVEPADGTVRPAQHDVRLQPGQAGEQQAEPELRLARRVDALAHQEGRPPRRPSPATAPHLGAGPQLLERAATGPDQVVPCRHELDQVGGRGGREQRGDRGDDAVTAGRERPRPGHPQTSASHLVRVDGDEVQRQHRRDGSTGQPERAGPGQQGVRRDDEPGCGHQRREGDVPCGGVHAREQPLHPRPVEDPAADPGTQCLSGGEGPGRQHGPSLAAGHPGSAGQQHICGRRLASARFLGL